MGIRDSQWGTMVEKTSVEVQDRRLADGGYGHGKGGDKRGLTVNQKRVPQSLVRCISKSKINRKLSDHFLKGFQDAINPKYGSYLIETLKLALYILSIRGSGR